MEPSQPAQGQNIAAVLHGISDLRVEPFPISEEVPPHHVRVAIKAVGICGSDVHYWQHGRIAHFVVEDKMVIGHESAGTVAAVGPGVTSLRVGDRVALEPGVPCWAHTACREGRYNLDPDIQFFATPPVHGSLATLRAPLFVMVYVDHPADFCYRLPDNVSHEEGAMCEPLSVGVHACRRAGVAPGKRVAILGAGPIGLVTLLAAKAFGADAVAITDLKPTNLELARRLGADYTHQTGVGELPQATAEAIRQGAGAPGGFQVVIDCAGFQATVQAAVQACAPGGRVVLVGLGRDEVVMPLGEAVTKEVDLLGSFRYCNTYPLCLSLLSSGRVDVRPLITHRCGFSQEGVQKGFRTASSEDSAVKVMFNL